MKTLQQLLDDYGDSCKCINWQGWVRECMQHPEMVVNKFNEILEEFKKQSAQQISDATAQLKVYCYADNWCRNKAHYMTLLGDNKTTDEWLKGTEQATEAKPLL